MTNKEFRELVRKDGNIPDNYTLLYCLDFLDLLEDSYKNFEVCIDEDGEITLDWIHSKSNMLSLTFTSEGLIVYASIGFEKTHGTVYLAVEYPTKVINLIKLYSKGE